jgi:hypothetical protein
MRLTPEYRRRIEEAIVVLRRAKESIPQGPAGAESIAWMRSIQGTCTFLGGTKMTPQEIASILPLEQHGPFRAAVQHLTLNAGWSFHPGDDRMIIASVERITSCLESALQHDAQIEDVETRRARPRAQKHFPTPPNLSWKDIHIMVADVTMQVSAGRLKRDYTFEEAGFRDNRSEATPDQTWGLLKAFAMRGGTLPAQDGLLDDAMRKNLKKPVGELRKRLKDLIPDIKGNPVSSRKHVGGYVTNFMIYTEEVIRLPTPAGATWGQVTITLIGQTRIRVSVRSRQRFAASTYEGKERRRWEAAEREGDLEREYDLRVLGLADAQGSPDARGRALVELLKAAGSLNRKSDDEAMLGLNEHLVAMLDIAEPPFEFNPRGGLWTARFQTDTDSR